MRRNRAVALALTLAAAAARAPAAGTWERQIEFAKKLGTFQYFDLAEVVLKRLKDDPRHIGIIKARVLRQIGDYYAFVAREVATGRAGLAGYIATLDLARANYREFLAHRSPTKAEKFDVRLTLSRIALAVGEVHLQMFHDPTTPANQRDSHKKKAVEIFKSAITQFQTAITSKKRDVDAKKKGEPKAPRAPKERAKWQKERAKWQKEYDELRTEYFRVQLEHLNAKVRYAKLLKALKIKSPPWHAELVAAKDAYIQLRLDFGNTPGAIQANLYLGDCYVELGPKDDQEAINRYQSVWDKRRDLKDFRRIPCRAAHGLAVLYKRQKKFDKAIDMLDDLIQFATGGVWDPEKPSIELIVEALKEVDGADDEQYGQRDTARAFLLQAECFAEKARQARPNERRKLYGSAYDISDGVGRVRGMRDPKYAALMEKWRKLSGRGRSVVVIQAELTGALRDRSFLRAAALYTELVEQGAISKKDLRKTWVDIAKCYNAAGRHHQAAIVFSAVARWFPEPVVSARQAAWSAVGCQNLRYQATKSTFDQAYLGRLRVFAERLEVGRAQSYTIIQARLARRDRNYKQAIDLLSGIAPSNPAYPDALYELGRTYRAQFEGLPATRRTSAAGKDLLGKMLAAFNQTLTHYRAALPKVPKEDTEGRERLTGIAAGALLMLTDAYLKPYLNDPAKVIQLTRDLQTQYPGFNKSRGASTIYLKRMHAGYILITHTKDAERAAATLRTIEESWKALKGFPDFKNLDAAASIGAYANSQVAARLEALAKTAAGAAKAALSKRALAARQRGVDLYVELLRIAPQQKLGTYRYVLQGLRARGRPEDHRTIIELAGHAIKLYGSDRRALNDLLVVKAALGFAHYDLGQYAEAIQPLAEVEDHYEGIYQAARKRYLELKEEFDKFPEKFRKAPEHPRRNPAQPDVKYKLAFCYLAAGKTDKFDWVANAYVDLTRIYAKQPELFWYSRYFLAETYRRQHKYEQAIKLIDRWFLSRPDLGGPATKKRFKALVPKILHALDKLDDPAKKATLKPLAERLNNELKR